MTGRKSLLREPEKHLHRHRHQSFAVSRLLSQVSWLWFLSSALTRYGSFELYSL